MGYRYAVGDYRQMRGDPGLFSFLGKVAKRVVGAAVGVARMTPVGGLLLGPQVLPAAMPRPQARRFTGPQMYGRAPMAPMKVQQRRISPGGTVGPSGCPAGHHFSNTTGACVPNRRMNVGNAKALRRAIRRQSGFVKLARRALQGSGYRIVSKGAGRRRVSVKEAGPGSVTVQ